MCDDLSVMIRQYYTLMQELDPRFHWEDPEWWKNSECAKVIQAPHGKGFAIVGYGVYVDDDVASEICELYCTSPLALIFLIRSCIGCIRFPFGFQILAGNTKAQRCFEGVMKRMKLEYIKEMGKEEGMSVYKYRVRKPASV